MVTWIRVGARSSTSRYTTDHVKFVAFAIPWAGATVRFDRVGGFGGHTTVGPTSTVVGVAFTPRPSAAEKKYENVTGQAPKPRNAWYAFPSTTLKSPGSTSSMAKGLPTISDVPRRTWRRGSPRAGRSASASE